MSLTSQEKLRKGDLFSERALQVMWGNSFDRLGHALAQDLFQSGGSPFTRRLIVVPDAHVKDFLVRLFARTPPLGIAAGLHIVPLHQAIAEIVDLSLSKLFLPSFLELSLAIESALSSVDSMDLDRYLGLRGSPLRSRRLPSLADELARVFVDYGLYADTSLAEWLLKRDWQQELWRQVFSSGWSYPLSLLNREIATQRTYEQIALFGFSYLAPIHMRFFAALEAHLYLFSPCSLFWEDVSSDKERLSLLRAWRKSGAKQDGEVYLSSGHPLLGNLGKLGRGFLQTLGAFHLVENECYIEESEASSLLGCIQRGILTLEQTELPIDDSIHIHSASSKLREVEILKDALETLLQREALPLSEICVVAPDIALYAPYIEMVFSETALPYVIENAAERSSGTLLSLLELPEGRYSLKSVTQLLKGAELREKWKFSLEEVEQLCRYFEKAHILENLSGHANSWEAGLDRLLMGLVLEGDDALPCIPFSDIDLFNRFLELFSRMQSDLAALSEARPLARWVEFLCELTRTYFIDDSLCEALHSLGRSCRTLKEHLFTFESMKRVLLSLSQDKTRASYSLGSALTFSSIGARSLTQPRVLWCLGMDEKAFPRRDRASSLCQIKQVSQAKPTRGSLDRFAFLEMLTKTRDRLIFSYERVDSQDNTHQSPSLLIEELNEYVKTHSGSRSIQTTHHPAFPLDTLYFSSDSLVKKWDPEEFAAASAFYSEEKQSSVPFLNGIGSESVQSISTRQLKTCARNPLQLYFNETLRLSLSEDEDEEKKQFILPAFKSSELRKGALETSIDALLKKAQARGEMPLGIFGSVASSDLAKETQEYEQYLQRFGVSAARTVTLYPDRIPAIYGEGIPIVGELEGVTSQGLLFYGDLSFPSLLRIWPLYLLYLQLESAAPFLLSMKEGRTLELRLEDPKQVLDAYVRYFLAARSRPCFVTSDVIKSVLKGDETLSQKENENLYWEYVKRREALPSVEEEMRVWKPLIQEAFCALMS
jgi:exodeoxyribonuclease V gamma subunit